MKPNPGVSIDASLDAVQAAFGNPDNPGRRRTGFHSCTLLSGGPGKAGSIAGLGFGEKEEIVALAEMITERRDKYLLAATRESGDGDATVVN